MSVRLIQDRLDSYGCHSTVEEEQTLREITQEIVLAGLGRTDFFQKAAFHGGTCLRIAHGLNRFSEDLDFTLQSPNARFVLAPYLNVLARELTAYGYDFEVDDRSKLDQTVRKAFLKDGSLGSLLLLSYRPTTGPRRKLRIKLEVDTNPPAGATFEMKVLDYPFPSAVRLFTLPSLFAGKMHALLCRNYLKGRDWYDFIWFTARKTRINHALLTSALAQVGPWRGTGTATDREWCLEQLRRKIEMTDWKQAREDVRRFVKTDELPSLELWTRQFFLTQCDKLA